MAQAPLTHAACVSGQRLRDLMEQGAPAFDAAKCQSYPNFTPKAELGERRSLRSDHLCRVAVRLCLQLQREGHIT